MEKRTSGNIGLNGLGQMVANGLISPNESDTNGEAANVVDGLFFIGRSIRYFADALYQHGEGQEESLVDACCGIYQMLERIAIAMEHAQK